MSNLTSHWDSILYMCPINSFKLPVQLYFMLGTHQIVTTILLSLHRTDIIKLSQLMRLWCLSHWRPAKASAQSHQSLRCSHTWSMKVDEESDEKSDISPHWKAVHERLKNEFTEDETYHISWDSSYHCTEEKIGNVLTHYGIAVCYLAKVYISGIYTALVLGQHLFWFELHVP